MLELDRFEWVRASEAMALLRLEGRWAGGTPEGGVWLVPLVSPEIAKPRLLLPKGTWDATGLVVDPTGRYAAVTSQYVGMVYIISIADGRVRRLPDAPASTYRPLFSADGRLLATTGAGPGGIGTPLNVWDVRTGIKLLVGPQDQQMEFYRLTTDGRMVAWYNGSVWAWDLETGEHELVRENVKPGEILPSGRSMCYQDQGAFHLLDLDTGESRFLFKPRPGRIRSAAMNDDETLIAVGYAHDNVIDLIALAGGEPHVLYDLATHVSFDPQGRFIAATNGEGQLHLWPIPEGKPKHALPRDEFMEYLRSQTTARAVPDTSSATGFAISYEPFAGWDALPQK